MRLVARRPVTLVDFKMTVPSHDEIAIGDVPERNGFCLHGPKQYPRRVQCLLPQLQRSLWADLPRILPYYSGRGRRRYGLQPVVLVNAAPEQT